MQSDPRTSQSYPSRAPFATMDAWSPHWSEDTFLGVERCKGKGEAIMKTDVEDRLSETCELTINNLKGWSIHLMGELQVEGLMLQFSIEQVYIWLNMSDLMERETTFFLLECLRLATPRCFSLALFPHAVGIGGRSRVTVHRHMFHDVTMYLVYKHAPRGTQTLSTHICPTFFCCMDVVRVCASFLGCQGRCGCHTWAGVFACSWALAALCPAKEWLEAPSQDLLIWILELTTGRNKVEAKATWLDCEAGHSLHRWISHVKCTEWCLRVPYFETNPYGGS